MIDIDDICFTDTETRSEPGQGADVRSDGTYRYAKRSFVIVSTWAIGDGPVMEVSLDRGFDGDWLQLKELPYAVQEHLKRCEQREAYMCAFNAGFDRQALYHGTADLPRLPVECWLDAMAQVMASNLPPNLEGASRALGRGGKQPDGKALIKLFCSDGGATPAEKPQEWLRFKSYGVQDTDELRAVWTGTRQLPMEEWQDYWASERINDRGVAIDLPFVERAAAIAAADRARINQQLKRWTNGQITAVTQAARIADWLFDRLTYSEARDILVKEWDDEGEPEDEDEEPQPVAGKLSIARQRIDALLAFYAALEEKQGLSDQEMAIVDVLEARQFGGSAAPAKFAKMLAQHDEGVLRGQYVFNGAQQTGRFSSKGVQIHNLTRSSLEDHEVPAIEMINEVEI